MLNFMVANRKSCSTMEAKFWPEKKSNEATSSCATVSFSRDKYIKPLKHEPSSSTDLRSSIPGNVVPNFNFPDGIFHKFYEGLFSRFLKKTFDYRGRGETKHILVNSLDSPIYYDTSHFLKKQINRFYPLNRRAAIDIKELEILSSSSTDGEKNEIADDLQMHPIQRNVIDNYLHGFTKDQIRSKVIGELLNSERDFIKILKNVQEAYLNECKNCKQLFTKDDTNNIFSNWEQIFELQTKFLQRLESKYNKKMPHSSCVGDSFLAFKNEFNLYSNYCNNHPLAMNTLQQLSQKEEYKIFFENIRLKNQLDAIPLDGFLLTPIQRICKYPLQLAELLKYTEIDHPDHAYVKEALKTMSEVAVSVNERKRRMESLENLILWQQQVEEWEGSNIVEDSSLLIHENVVSRVFTGLWYTDVSVFLFDHQLIFCKRYLDHFKNEFLVYKGRVSLTYCEIMDIPERKDTLLGISVRYGIKIQNMVENKWLLMCCRNPAEKLEWLESFRNERELVLRDKRNKLEITAKDKYLARMIAATCNYDRIWSNHEDKMSKKSVGLSSYSRKVEYRK